MNKICQNMWSIFNFQQYLSITDKGTITDQNVCGDVAVNML